MKNLDSDAKFLQQLLLPTESKGRPATLPRLTSSEKKSVMYEALIAKKPNKQLNCESLLRIPASCSSFNSKRILDFVNEFTKLSDIEKQLAAHLRRKETELKQVRKDLQ